MYLLSYKYYGLFGMGVAYILNYFIYMILVYVVSKRKFDFTFSTDYKKQLLVFGVLLAATFLTLILLPNKIVSYSISSLCVIAGVIYSLFKLNNKLNLKSFAISILSRNKEGK